MHVRRQGRHGKAFALGAQGLNGEWPKENTPPPHTHTRHQHQNHHTQKRMWDRPQNARNTHCHAADGWPNYGSTPSTSTHLQRVYCVVHLNPQSHGPRVSTNIRHALAAAKQLPREGGRQAVTTRQHAADKATKGCHILIALSAPLTDVTQVALQTGTRVGGKDAGAREPRGYTWALRKRFSRGGPGPQ
jgi:hypothetical protein